MPTSKISLNRNITSYSKVQAVIGKLIRNNKFFIKNNRIKGLTYLDIGCGLHVSSNFVNLDYFWRPEIDVCWDVTKGTLPFPDNSFDGIFSEHCFEHISLEAFKHVLSECYRMLKPGGDLRIVMPDGELYLDIYQKKKKGIKAEMPYEEGYITAMARINGIFRNHGHQFIYDYQTVEYLLNEIGFSKAKKESYQSGRNAQLYGKDTDWREIESLYVEATK